MDAIDISEGPWEARDCSVGVVGLPVVDVECVLGPWHGYEDRSA